MFGRSFWVLLFKVLFYYFYYNCLRGYSKGFFMCLRERISKDLDSKLFDVGKGLLCLNERMFRKEKNGLFIKFFWYGICIF